jgi:uncharacterized repeat protein (TIGR01451 family)
MKSLFSQGLRPLPTAILLAGLDTTITLVPEAHAATFDVNDTGDVGDANPGDGVCDDGSGKCTLRAAIEEANALAGSDTINLHAPGPYNLTAGELTVSSEISLNGNGESISAGGSARVFYVTGIFHPDGAGNLSLNGVTIRDGVADAGGGILIDSGGMANILNSAILSNTATVQGGGISNFLGTLNVANSTISGNRAKRDGGGIHDLGFSGSGTGDLTNVTITDNTADFDNSDGGGIYVLSPAFNLKNTIVAGNRVGTTGVFTEPDCINLGGLTTHGNNFIGASTITFTPGTPNSNDDFVGTSGSPLDPQFGPLTGSPAYYPLLAGSLAIDQIDVISATFISSVGNPLFSDGDPITTDQAGTPRPQGALYDIGAFEALSVIGPNLRITKSVIPTTPVAPGQTITYTLSFDNAGVVTATNVVITDIVPITLTNFSVISSGAVITDTGVRPGYVWSVTDLAQGEAGVITITGQISPGLTSATTFTNTAIITTTAVDSDITDNEAEVSVTVVPPDADLAISKGSVRNSSIGTGLITYTIKVTNLGPGAAHGAVVSDTIPTGIGGGTWLWTCEGGNGAVCKPPGSGSGDLLEPIPTFPAGGQVAYTITATLVDTQVIVVNTVTVTAPEGIADPKSRNNIAIDISGLSGDIYLPIIFNSY